MPTSRLPLVWLTVAASILFVALNLQFGDVQADGEIGVPSGVSVTAEGAAPVFECKWELPDVDSFTPGSQYGEDNDPNDEPGFPCDREDVLEDFGNGLVVTGTAPTMADGVRNVIQVLPNAEDDPEARRIENWVAVDHPGGLDEIDDVYWKIYHPDGSFKTQRHATRVEGPTWGNGVDGANVAEDYDLADLGLPNASGTMFGAAYETGQVSADAVTADNWGIRALVLQRQKDLYYGEWEIHKEQLCGEYLIEAYAVSSDGVEAMMWNTIDIQCFYNLEIDFTSVDWGTLTPGGYQVVGGDNVFGTAGQPSVKNTGNSGMQVGVHFTPLVQQGVPGPKVITHFDAAFGLNFDVLEWIDPIWAEGIWDDTDQVPNGGNPNDVGQLYSGQAWFNDTSLNQVLCANEVGKLDLSIHTPAGIPNGQYVGTVTILGQWAPAVCHDGNDGVLRFEDNDVAPVPSF